MRDDPDILALRARIDEIDDTVRALLDERVRVVVALWAAKRAGGVPLRDLAREVEILDRVAAGELLGAEAARRIFSVILEETRAAASDPPGS